MSYKVDEIPLSDIYCDNAFNIRGEIRQPDIVDLARNINTHGLMSHIIARKNPHINDPELGHYKYQIVAGHRRFKAFEFLQRESIPCRLIDVDDKTALFLNFSENVNRKDLNILEEAHGVKRFLEVGETIESISKAINRGKKWVVIRRNLLGMPKDIQDDVAAGWLTQAQILELSDIDDPNKQMEIVKQIKTAKARNERRLPDIKPKVANPTVLKRRNPDAIMDMINHFIDETGVTSPFTRMGAWANGDISDLDLYRDAIDYFKMINVPYEPPLEVRHLIAGIVPTP